jgi:hypothetical protein
MSVEETTLMTPVAPRKKSNATCLIIALIGVVLGGLLLIVIAIGVAFWINRSKASEQAGPTPDETTYATPFETETPEPSEEPSTPAPEETPEYSGSLDSVIQGLANAPAISASRADSTLRRDVMRTIITGLASPGCRVLAHDSRIVSPPDDDGVWVEGWDLSICGKMRNLRIKFTPSSDGGTNYTITE